MNQGFSHIGFATHDATATIDFYSRILGMALVADHTYDVDGGGAMRLLYFDAGCDQFIVFMANVGISGIPADFDTGINGGLGVPRGIYHLALRLESLEALHGRRGCLEMSGIEVSPVVDLGHAHSIFLRDPNGIELEYCAHLRPFDVSDLGRVDKVRAAFSQ